MSGKLIMKRKLDKTRQSSRTVEVINELPSVSSLDNLCQNKVDNRTDDDNESSQVQQENKRLRCDTPPSEPGDLDSPTLPQANERNRHLLEAIQLKMLELQSELDAFEHDVEAHECDYYDQANQQQPQMSEQDAEALGFAMCAQETMLFLQREGVPSESLLYTRLHDALVGSPQPDHVFHF